MEHANVIEHHVLCVLDVDSVPATDDCHVAKRDVICADADSSLHDSADKSLRVADHERSAHGAVQVNGRRSNRVRPAKAADHDDHDGSRRQRAGPAGLAARLRVLQPQPRQQTMCEDLCREPAGGVEEECEP